MVPKDGHMEDMSAPCKQVMCWQCQDGHFHVEFGADVSDTWTPQKNDVNIVVYVG